MANTYSQIYIQYVFAVKGRENLLHQSWRNEVFKYISGIITGKGQKAIIVNGVGDHVHAFVGLNPSCRVVDLIRDIKNGSTNYINGKRYLNRKFSWQEGYGAFSYSHSQIENVYRYIANQESHHRKKTFRDEYLDLLKKFSIEYKDEYLFDWLD